MPATTIVLVFLIVLVGLLIVWVNGVVKRLDDLEPYADLGKRLIAKADEYGTVNFTMTTVDITQHPEND